MFTRNEPVEKDFSSEDVAVQEAAEASSSSILSYIIK